MEKEDYNNACLCIFKEYGRIPQRFKLIEECSELIRAIAKDDKENTIEEIADILVIIDQFLLHTDGLSEKIQQIKEQKVLRQLKRIESIKIKHGVE